LAASLKDRYGVDAELIRGAGGIFDVTVNGNLIFSKHQVGNFPDHRTIFELIGDPESSDA